MKIVTNIYGTRENMIDKDYLLYYVGIALSVWNEEYFFEPMGHFL